MQAYQGSDRKERERWIAEAAYFRAERRGFIGGDAVADWIEAEHEVDAELRKQEHGRLLADLESRLERVGKKLKTLKKKTSTLAAEARREIQQDVEKLGHLRASFEKRLEEIRAHGAEAGQRTKEHAEALWGEISTIVDRVAKRLGNKKKQ